jgi:hypothetical protein
MVYVNMRLKVTDYKAWKKIFDNNEANRRAAGATGTKWVFQDVNDPNTVTTLLEWDKVENARKFNEDPKLRELQMKAGMIGAPSVATILTSD